MPVAISYGLPQDPGQNHVAQWYDCTFLHCFYHPFNGMILLFFILFTTLSAKFLNVSFFMCLDHQAMKLSDLLC